MKFSSCHFIYHESVKVYHFSSEFRWIIKTFQTMCICECFYEKKKNFLSIRERKTIRFRTVFCMHMRRSDWHYCSDTTIYSKMISAFCPYFLSFLFTVKFHCLWARAARVHVWTPVQIELKRRGNPMLLPDVILSLFL